MFVQPDLIKKKKKIFILWGSDFVSIDMMWFVLKEVLMSTPKHKPQSELRSGLVLF